MASRILNSQIVASVKRAGVRYQSTAIDGGFTAERDAIKHHAAGNIYTRNNSIYFAVSTKKTFSYRGR